MKDTLDVLRQAVDHKLSNIRHSLKNGILQEIETVRKREANILYYLRSTSY